MRLSTSAIALVASLLVNPGVHASELPQRWVSAGGALSEWVSALGAESKLVGVDTTSQHPESLKSLPSIGYQRQLSAEGVLSLKPDVLIGTEEMGPAAVLLQIRGAGVPVEMFSAQADLASLEGTLQHLGRLLGDEAQAAQVFKDYQQQVVKNAQAMAKVIVSRGYKIVSGGTQNHLMLVDMIGKDVSGKQAEEALGKAHITVNKNSVPNDPRKPFVTSGLRIGTPAVTTRGYREPDCVALAEWICDVLDNPNDEAVIAGVRENVEKQCKQFPVYG